MDDSCWSGSRLNVTNLNRYAMSELLGFTPHGIAQIEFACELGLTRVGLITIFPIHLIHFENIVEEADCRGWLLPHFLIQARHHLNALMVWGENLPTLKVIHVRGSGTRAWGLRLEAIRKTVYSRRLLKTSSNLCTSGVGSGKLSFEKGVIAQSSKGIEPGHLPFADIPDERG